jgi:predicted amidophosphoribosyltransferase
VISEGPALIEALPGELQNALNGALCPGEELLIAVRANRNEAFAATADRIMLLKEPLIRGAAPVEVREVALSSLSNVRTEARPVGGRLSWETAAVGAPTFIEYPTYDASKYSLVAKRLLAMTGAPGTMTTPSSTTPPASPAIGQSCPRCQATVPAEGSWCPKCGLQVTDPCWECGRPLSSDDQFCAACGTPNTEPAVTPCPSCQASVARGYGYCASCGSQARPVCEECDRPLRREWSHCPSCGGAPAGQAESAPRHVARLRGDEPDDPSAWLRTTPAPEEAESRNAAAVKAYERGSYREAVRLFREAVEAAPDNASYWTNLGVSYAQLDDDLQAFAAYRRAVELNPGETGAYLYMAELYMERERTEEARELWEKVIQIAPDSEEAEEARQNLRSADDV